MDRQECEHRARDAITKETLHVHREELLGIPVTLVDAVEIKKCGLCNQVISKKIPDLQNLIAAMALVRVTDPRRLGADDIRFLRKALNWTAKKLADRLEVAEGTVSRWENGKEPIGGANEKILRLIAGTEMASSAPAIDFSAEAIANMKIEDVRSAEDMHPMCFERVRFKRPSHRTEDQWDTRKEAA
ncbi:MAG TPA: helix-turn-helix domain-containing protein [Stellaceae bacterium]|nr:helix-turn-helix domain-containing protein [Stellaceae bacterium]